LKKLAKAAANGQGLLQGWNSLLVRPEPLLIKDIKVQVNKQKLNPDSYREKFRINKALPSLSYSLITGSRSVSLIY
jgi:hypothetical protein